MTCAIAIILGSMCQLPSSYQKTSRLASNLHFQGFSHIFFSPAPPGSGWWGKAAVGPGASVHVAGCQSAVLVPVCRQHLLTGRRGDVGAREMRLFLPPFLPLLLHHQTSPPPADPAAFFPGFHLSRPNSAPLQLVSGSGARFSDSSGFFASSWASWPIKLHQCSA